MAYLPQLNDTRRPARVRLADVTPAVLRSPDGGCTTGELQIVSLSGGLLGMPTGVELRANIHLNIPLADDPAWWTMCMKTAPVDGFCANSLQSTGARVIRSTLGVWTFWAAPSDVAELMNDRGVERRTRLIDYLGTYSMPFSFTVECVPSTACPVPQP